ncbi:zinc-dependent metalloprotease [Corynebacterium uterequi]|uniref:Putative hydrolase n=1 Tax=Corynebacterium uterequi TaxID=1072256 RepID=A0A0G3HH95_9CORY|nr:zinc-dependent metalloprotease [Corynebacterium uterequi]AKK10552.1 putative hydrolase [Corynebacterium uterequi]
MSNGFGFGFSQDDDDQDRDRQHGRGGSDNPFAAFGFSMPGAGGSGGAGGLGDIFSQFGQMLSGMGSSMNSPDGRGSVNYDLGLRIARQQIGTPSTIRAQDRTAVEESVRLAELWLDEATTLPSVSGTVAAWNEEDWLTATLPAFKRMVSPVAEHMNRAQLDGLPEEARDMMGGLNRMMQQMSGMNFGMQLGHALGDLASQTLTGSDFGLPITPTGTIALLPKAVQGAARELNLPGQDVLVYAAAREAARQRLFTHVPWLVERLVSSVEEYAVGLVIDNSHVEEATRDLGLDSGNPEALQDAIARLQGMDLSPRISSTNAGAVSRLETLLALVEGWAEYVVTEALGDRLPSAAALSEAWTRRRDTGGGADKVFSTVVGIEFASPKVAAAVELWRRATVAVGVDKRDAVWEHPDLLPSAEDLDNPASFIDRLLDDAGDSGFAEEFAKLEEMLRREDDGTNDADDTGVSDADS